MPRPRRIALQRDGVKWVAKASVRIRISDSERLRGLQIANLHLKWRLTELLRETALNPRGVKNTPCPQQSNGPSMLSCERGAWASIA